MIPFEPTSFPPQLKKIELKTKELEFDMASEYKTGSFLRALAASKPGGRLLELGTGTGFGTAWILAGMDGQASLLSVDNNAQVSAVAAQYLGEDRRLTLKVEDATVLIPTLEGQLFDFIFADAWVGKFELLEETLALLGPGGVYIIDDLLPQPNWPENHGPRIAPLIESLQARSELSVVSMAWASGLVVATKCGK